MRRIWTAGEPVYSKICCHDRYALQSKDRPQKKYAVRPFAGSCTGAASALGPAAGAAFVIGDDAAGALAFSCFFWLRDALSLSISFRTVRVC